MKTRIAIIIPVDQLTQEPYASTVCYPRASTVEISKRIGELHQLGVEALEFFGKPLMSTAPVLGKGYVGIVVVAHVCGVRVALKMRRIDADRINLEHEAELLARANSVNVGPKFLAVNRNFLLMQLVEGYLFEDWLRTNLEKNVVQMVLTDVLEMCWRLDENGLDHGELSKAPKHLLVDKQNVPFIVDFETASTQRKVANVTSMCQYLFGGNSNAKQIISQKFGEKNSIQLISFLKKYRRERNRRNFEEILKVALN